MTAIPIVALDVSATEDAVRVVDQLGESCGFYKVGSELFTAAGPPILEYLRRNGKRVFLDLKFHDIPNTVRAATASASRLGATLVTAHASGGEAMLRAAVEGAGQDCGVLAVTVLTSLTGEDLAVSWGRENADVPTEVVRLARVAGAAGAHGVVCGGDEIADVRRVSGDRLATLVPGVRFADGAQHDQRRVITPHEAARRGARYLVIGRAVTQSPEPAVAMGRVLEEIRRATGVSTA